MSEQQSTESTETNDDLLRRLQLSIDGFARNEHMSTWVSNQLHQESKAEIERLRAALEKLTNGYKYSTEVITIAKEALAGTTVEETVVDERDACDPITQEPTDQEKRAMGVSLDDRDHEAR